MIVKNTKLNDRKLELRYLKQIADRQKIINTVFEYLNSDHYDEVRFEKMYLKLKELSTI